MIKNDIATKNTGFIDSDMFKSMGNIAYDCFVTISLTYFNHILTDLPGTTCNLSTLLSLTHLILVAKQQKNARVVVCVEARERVAYNRCGVGKRMELMGIWATKSAQRERKYGPLPGGTIFSFEL